MVQSMLTHVRKELSKSQRQKRWCDLPPGIASRGRTGRGRAPIGANATMGALCPLLAIGEVQALLNPHVGSGDRPHPPQRERWTRSIPIL